MVNKFKGYDRTVRGETVNVLRDMPVTLNLLGSFKQNNTKVQQFSRIPTVNIRYIWWRLSTLSTTRVKNILRIALPIWPSCVDVNLMFR